MSATQRLKRRLAELQHECVRLAAVEVALGAAIREREAWLSAFTSE